MKVVLLHAYSGNNLGDGFLVEAALEIIQSAFPTQKIDFTICASDPSSFEHLNAKIVSSMPGFFGYSFEFLRTLGELSQFDIIVGVGGGYLRASSCKEFLKTLLVHGPQIWAAGKSSTYSVYLPQSVGPLYAPTSRILAVWVRSIDKFWVRDDRSLLDLGFDNKIERSSDMAVLTIPPRTGADVDPTPVLSVRAVRGVVPKSVFDLAQKLGQFDGHIQSTVSSNNDTEVMLSLRPRRLLTKSELFDQSKKKRVVIAVRLHAALMALAAGHYVIHLSYERKGFAAFKDLGLESYVHNVFNFSAASVSRQARKFLFDQASRDEFDNRIAAIGPELFRRQEKLIASLNNGHKRNRV